MNASEIVNKVPASPAGRWNYAHVLRDDGVGYLPCRQAGGDYVEAVPAHPCAHGIRTSMFVTTTYLIFLKMADERKKSGQETKLPRKYTWAELVKLYGDADSIRTWGIQYRHPLENPGKEGGMLGTIFFKAKNKIQDPAMFECLVKMNEKEPLSTLPSDVKGGVGYIN